MAYSVEKVLSEIERLIKGYSLERRASTQPFLLSAVQDFTRDYTYNPQDTLVRETLIEHVGSLPIVATALYPYINDEDVNIGDSLTMLAIHDIGELITGDENTFTKQKDASQREYEAGLSILHESYHDLYKDVESKTSKSAKFAKSIDKITPDIFDYLTPANITIERYKYFVGINPTEIIDVVVKHKRPYMTWNPFMTEFHNLLMSRLREKLAQ